MSGETRTFKYSMLLEWTGTVEVDVEDGDDDETIREAAFDIALDEALSNLGGHSVYDSEITEVEK